MIKESIKLEKNVELLRETRIVYEVFEGDLFGVIHAVEDGIILRLTEIGCEDAD
jgi:hypothetical protein